MELPKATQAVGPASSRTRFVLFAPFHWSRTWKKTATGYVATMGTFFFPLPLFVVPVLLTVLKTAPKIRPLWIDLAWVGLVLLTALYVWIFALCSHLQFPVLVMVLDRELLLRPEWNASRERAWRWTKAKLAMGTLLGLPPLALIVPFVAAFSYHSQLRAWVPAAFFLTIALGYLLLMLLFCGLGVVNDLAMTAMALEDLPTRSALERAWQMLRAEPGPMSLYLLLKIALAIGGQIAVSAALQMAMWVLMIPFWICGVLAGLLHLPALVAYAGLVLFGLAFIGMYLYASILGMGTVQIFLESYKVIFLAGRYPLLAQRLARSATPPAPPPFLSAPMFPTQVPGTSFVPPAPPFDGPGPGE